MTTPDPCATCRIRDQHCCDPWENHFDHEGGHRMSWSPADDYDDDGNYQPGPNRTYPRFTRCQPGCCTGTPLCHHPEGDHDD